MNQYCEGDFSGNGVYTWTDDSIDTNKYKYEGSFEESDFSGYGVLRYRNGAIYQGLFEHDKLSGNGNYTNPSGVEFPGVFQKDHFLDKGSLIPLYELN